MKPITKILTLGILFLFMCTLQLSAQKCKFDYNKKDPITGEATKGNTFTISTNSGGFTATPICKMGFNRSGDDYYLGMVIYFYGNFRENIRKGDPIIFKLSNGEVITITSQDEVVPAAQATASGIITMYQGKYDIDAATIQKMAENPPTFVRMSRESKVFEKEINSKTGKQISQAAACILQ